MDNFSGENKVLYMIDALENEDAFYQFENYSLKKQRGYYIYYETNQEMKNYMLAEGEMGRMPERGRRSETIKRDTAVVKNYKKALRKKKSLRPKSAFANPAYVAGGLVAAMVLIYGVRSAVQYQGNQKMQEVFQQQEMTDAKNVTGAQQGEEETDTVSKIETVKMKWFLMKKRVLPKYQKKVTVNLPCRIPKQVKRKPRKKHSKPGGA